MNIDKLENLKDALGLHIAKKSSKLVDATGEDRDKLIDEIKNIQDDITSAYRDPSMIDSILSKYILVNVDEDEHLRMFGMSEENIQYAKDLEKSQPLECFIDDIQIIEMGKLLSVILRYQMILFDKIEDDENFRYAPDEADQTSDRHLLWMLYQIKFNDDQSLTKKHRWLGFIQGVMVMKGYITVSDERDQTRDIFNGS